jgi:hypothetical protein
MSARPKNSFELKGKTITASGQTLALADITAVRRKTEYRPRRAGVILIICGLALGGWSWRDETAQRHERQAKFARDYAEAEKQPAGDDVDAALGDLRPLDISQALQRDALGEKWGAGLLGVGLVYTFVRRRRHHVIVTTEGRTASIYWSKRQAEATQIVEEIAAKMG